jgi:hypothetical protein
MLFNCDRVVLHLPGQAVASLETLFLTESFLGEASDLFRFGRLAMHSKSPGSLCVMRLLKAPAWDPMFDRACFCMLCGLTWDFVASRQVTRATNVQVKKIHLHKVTEEVTSLL